MADGGNRTSIEEDARKIMDLCHGALFHPNALDVLNDPKSKSDLRRYAFDTTLTALSNVQALALRIWSEARTRGTE